MVESSVTSRDRAEALRTAQNRVLELAVRDAPLTETLQELALTIESLSVSGVLTSILLLSEAGTHLHHAVGPSLPVAYNEAIDGIATGPGVGSCGSAVHRKEPVFVSDIASDPLWINFRELALSHGLRACWSIPIMSPNREVLGTFAMYYREPRQPNPADLELVDIVVGMATLVIERKRAEEALRESEARQRFLLELGDATRSLLDPEAVVATTTRMLGEKLGAARVLYADVHETEGRATVRPDWAAPGVAHLPTSVGLAEVGGAIVGYLQQGLTLSVDDVRSHPVTKHSVAFLDAVGIAALISVPLIKNGQLVANFNVHMLQPRRWTLAEQQLIEAVAERTWEAIQRAVTESALRDSEARFRLMADAVPQMVWITDRNGRMEFFNRQFCDYTGAPYEPLAPDEVAAKFIPPEDGARVVAAFQASLRTGTPFVIEHRIYSATGECRWFLARAEPYRDPASGEVVRWFGASTDIHDRKMAEQQLRDLNQTLEERVNAALAERKLLAELVENTDAFVQVIDFDFRWLAINKAAEAEFERIYGVRPAIGESMLDLLAEQPEQQAAMREAWKRALAGEAFTELGEFGLPGRERFYEMKYHALSDAQGNRIGAYQFVYDVTDRLHEQRRLQETEEALRQSQKMEAIGQLTGGVAHDFNNLLTPIVGALDMLNRKGLGGEREQRLIAGAALSAERAKTLVQRLLAFARRQPLQAIAVDIAQLVRGMGDLIGSTTGPQIDVVVDAPDDLPPAKADPNQIEMALLNLAVNARDAMPNGGTLRITARLEAVAGGHEANLAPGSYIKLSVADTGSGMDEATLKRAVEPFFSTKGVGQGTGLGLSMVHGLASQLGGALTIQSGVALGTNVELWLPRSVDAAELAQSRSDDTDQTVLRGKALLVDDEELVRLSTADMLSDLGYAIVEASSAEQALEVIETGERFDLLVTDHLMPGMSGTELANRIRAMNPGLPVLLVSGYAETIGVDPSLPRLTKPFRRDELATSIENIVMGRAR